MRREVERVSAAYADHHMQISDRWRVRRALRSVPSKCRTHERDGRRQASRVGIGPSAAPQAQASCHAPAVFSAQRLAWQEACASREAWPDADAGGERDPKQLRGRSASQASVHSTGGVRSNVMRRPTSTSPCRAQPEGRARLWGRSAARRPRSGRAPTGASTSLRRTARGQLKERRGRDSNPRAALAITLSGTRRSSVRFGVHWRTRRSRTWQRQRRPLRSRKHHSASGGENSWLTRAA